MRVKIGNFYRLTNNSETLEELGIDSKDGDKIVFVHKRINKSPFFKGPGYQVVIEMEDFLEVRAKDLVEEV